MAMGKRKPRQEPLFVAADRQTPSAGHPFYQTLNELLAEAGFDRWIERRCAAYYEQAEKRGKPSLPPVVYFRMLLVGYLWRPKLWSYFCRNQGCMDSGVRPLGLPNC